MEAMVLNNSRLNVDILTGANAYNGSRFDHGGQVRQITLDGKHTFLSSEILGFDQNYGFGLHNEFDILGPQQYASTAVETVFTK